MRYDDFLLCRSFLEKDEFPLPVYSSDSRMVLEPAPAVHNASIVQPCNRIEYAGTAKSLSRFFPDRLEADRILGNRHAFNGPGSSPHSEAYVGSLECRARSARNTMHVAAPDKGNFGVRPYVQRYGGGIGLPGIRGEQHSDVIGTYISSHSRRKVDISPFCDVYPEVSRFDIHRYA